MFCLWTFCLCGRFVPPDVLSLWTFCPYGRFVSTDVLSHGRYVSGCFVSGHFVSGRFVSGRFVSGRFVSGRFVPTDVLSPDVLSGHRVGAWQRQRPRPLATPPTSSWRSPHFHSWEPYAEKYIYVYICKLYKSWVPGMFGMWYICLLPVVECKYVQIPHVASCCCAPAVKGGLDQSLNRCTEQSSWAQVAILQPGVHTVQDTGR
jgi:hypothetical protein